MHLGVHDTAADAALARARAVAAAEMAASSNDEAGEPEEVAAEAALSQCERNPLCTRGYKHGGRGGLCSTPAEAPPAAKASSSKAAPARARGAAGASAQDTDEVIEVCTTNPYTCTRGSP